MSKRALASYLGFLVITALGLLPRWVHAQTITINTGSQATELVDANHNPVSHSYTPATSQLYWVNLAECKNNWVYQVSVTTLGIGSANMEVWAGLSGADCTQAIYRYTVGSQQCWRVASVGIIDQTSAVYIPVENVVAQLFTTDLNSADVPQGTAADCDRIANSGIPEAGLQINLNFYVFAGGASAAPTYSATWTGAGYDLIGPQAPTGVSLQSADTELYVNWGQVVVTDLAGYHLYCQDLATSDSGINLLGLNDGGLTTDAGTVVCPANNTPMTPGCVPPDGMQPSGTISSTLATSGIASKLNNGDNYACAVACYDTMENNGPLSSFATGVPWYVDDFFSLYRRDLGKAGGGFCSIGHAGTAVGFLIPLASIALLALRRRRSKH